MEARTIDRTLGFNPVPRLGDPDSSGADIRVAAAIPGDVYTSTTRESGALYRVPLAAIEGDASVSAFFYRKSSSMR